MNAGSGCGYSRLNLTPADFCVMAICMFGRVRKLVNDKPGKEGW
jgi:hypothetical protein